MTLLTELLLGVGAILLISSIENSSLVCSVEWVWAGAGKNSWPAGCSHGNSTTNPSGNINNPGTGLSSLPISGGGGPGGSVIRPYGGM